MEQTKTRLRATAEDTVRDKDDANRRLGLIRDLRRKQQGAVDEFRATIAGPMRIAIAGYEAAAAKISAELRALEAWWKVQGKKESTKSIQLPNGKLGSRIVGAGWDMPPDEELVHALEGIEREDLIITVRQPNKPAIKKIPEIHPDLGISRKPGDDRFFLQTDGDQVEKFVSVFAALRDQASDPQEAA